MDYQIIWTSRAERSFGKILVFLQEHWPERVVRDFVIRVNDVISLIQKLPNVGMKVQGKPDMRSVVINRQTKLFYRIEGENIILFKFFDTRQHPSKALE
jgi:plasmid stabilization system protein ParE